MQMHGYEHVANAGELISNEELTQKAQKLEMTQQSTWKDSINIFIPARGDKEYKFYLEKGATLEYIWSTNDAKLFFDFHGEPEGDTTGYFKSFNKSTESRSSGSLTTSFAGTHGWYWKNNNPLPVTITLRTKGEYKRLDLKDNIDQIKPVLNLKTTTHDTIDTF